MNYRNEAEAGVDRVLQRCSVKMMFLKMSQNSHKLPVSVFLIKLEAEGYSYIRNEALAQVLSC